MTDKAALLARLATLTAANAGRDHLALRLGSAYQLILGGDGAAITVANDSVNRTTLCATTPAADRLQDLQDITGEGPCRDAYRTARSTVARLGDGARRTWPEFTRAALQAVGPVTMYSFPMQPGGHTVGVISVYVTDGRSLPESDDTAQFLADTIGAALLQDGPPAELNGDGPWTSRSRIHNATGMVVAQLRVPPADALAILRAHAYATSRTLAEVAESVIDRTIDFREGSDDR
ncbi:GAF and ANTAR domain-containing protein [Kribbella sp. NPDC051770]|uniref:GAF and ANTAR domain-containing protein n=1 Tax=Kribbella sp. NPDC051770 TaxID=3155413 RepID=UPI00342DD7E3